MRGGNNETCEGLPSAREYLVQATVGPAGVPVVEHSGLWAGVDPEVALAGAA
ncbi:hypothetical protein [Rubritalea squalenifaciens]|uniref:hypothetical protein n=1 Tax=Rubritalea squalenifaciens TaxID=407226 RepID=UPI001356720E|nr:hypothetical protein [Rubritalea squalenifaciens]